MVYGEVEHGFLGIKQKRLSEKQRQQMKIDGGVQVTAVSKDSPAEKAGIAIGDIIIKFDGKKVKGSGHLYGLVRSYLPNVKVKLDIIRDSIEVAVTVALGQTNDDGYFGFRQNSDLANHPGLLSTAEPADKFAKAKKQIAGLNSKSGKENLKPEIEELNARIQELELNFKELSAKISELTKELDK